MQKVHTAWKSSKSTLQFFWNHDFLNLFSKNIDCSYEIFVIKVLEVSMISTLWSDDDFIGDDDENEFFRRTHELREHDLRKQCENYGNLLSYIFDTNFVKLQK